MTTQDCIRWIYEWQYTDDDHFGIYLVRIFKKADSGNRRRLRQGFPEMDAALQLWEEAEDQDAFFKNHGLGDKKCHNHNLV